MSRAPDWTKAEFKKLVMHHTLSSSQLASELETRSVGAVDAVRAGVHDFHQGKDTPTLSEMMRSYLSKKKFTLTCAVCKETF